jgi:uncharacterized protein YndB with AHSA1/START domain
VFVREFRHPVERVWAALTDPDHLKDWAPFTAERDLSEPGDTRLTMLDGEAAVDLPCVVTRAEPPTLLEYTWGEDQLRWELTPSDGGTRLTLRHRVQGPEWVPMVAAGWHICLDVADRLLAGDRIGAIRGQDALDYGWQALTDAYRADLT